MEWRGAGGALTDPEEGRREQLPRAHWPRASVNGSMGRAAAAGGSRTKCPVERLQKGRLALEALQRVVKQPRRGLGLLLACSGRVMGRPATAPRARSYCSQGCRRSSRLRFEGDAWAAERAITRSHPAAPALTAAPRREASCADWCRPRRGRLQARLVSARTHHSSGRCGRRARTEHDKVPHREAARVSWEV